MKAKSDQLIKELVANLKPVQVVSFQFVDLFKVVVVALLCVFAAVMILGLRIDIGDQILTGKFIFDTVLLLILGVLSIVAAFSLSVPSLSTQNIDRLPISIFGLIVIATGYSFLIAPNPFLYMVHGFSCVTEIISISILPSSILFYSIRRAAPLKRDILGILVLMSGISFGLLGTQLTCFDSTPLHLLVWHILPAGIVMFFGVWLSRKILIKI